jgi:hypothetical protein
MLRTALFVSVLTLVGTAQTTQAENRQIIVNATIAEASADSGRVVLENIASITNPTSESKECIRLLRQGQPTTAVLRDDSQRESLGILAKGDRVRAEWICDGGPPATFELKSIRLLRANDRRDVDRDSGPFYRAAALILPMIALWMFASMISKWQAMTMFFVGHDGRTSNSKTQGTLWLFLILAAFCATFILRIYLGDWLLGSIAMPVNLAILAGISGLSFVGAKGIAVSQAASNKKAEDDRKARIKTLEANKNPKTDEESKELAELQKLEADSAPVSGVSAITELVKNDSELSLGDFQMILVTLVAVVVYLVQLWHFLETMNLSYAIALPDIDGSLTTLFGISQASYLGNKAAGGKT